MNPSKLLKEILDKSGLTQVQLADRLGVSHPTLNSWVNGKSTPHSKKAAKIDEIAFELLGVGIVTKNLVDQAVSEAMLCKLDIHDLTKNSELVERLTVFMTYNTNSIEGSTMTLADNEKVLVEQKILKNRSAREQLEAKNHQATVLWLLDQLASNTFDFTPQLVKDLHLRLMNGLVSDAGEYRRHNVRIMGSHVTVANYQRISEKMKTLFNAKWPTTFEDFALFHAEFEKIHPFSDGNGRVGRLLLVGLMLERNLTPVVIRREARAAYYHYLETAQMEDKSQPLTYLLARETVQLYSKLMNL